MQGRGAPAEPGAVGAQSVFHIPIRIRQSSPLWVGPIAIADVYWWFASGFRRLRHETKAQRKETKAMTAREE